MTEDHTARIAALNDAFRTSFRSGKVLLTQGIAALPAATVEAITAKVRRFEDFSEENDPRGEHDFGSFKQDGVSIFWKIDYYDLATEYGSPAPTITLTRGDGALKAVIGIQASPSRRSPPGKGRSGMYPRLPDRQGGNGFSVPSLFMCSGAMKNRHKPPGVRAGPASCCGKGLGRAPAPGEDEPMKKWVFDGARQFRRFLKPRRGKVILTRHACGKMCEYFLDQETVYDVYRYGEEIKKSMIVRRYANYTAGIIITTGRVK